MVPESPKLGVRELKWHLHDALGCTGSTEHDIKNIPPAFEPGKQCASVAMLVTRLRRVTSSRRPLRGRGLVVPETLNSFFR